MNSSDDHTLDNRVQETEIRLAFLEKELEEYKDAVQTLHARLENLEKTVAVLRRTASGSTEGGDLASGSGDAG